ncbi:conserved hypothetical protein [Neospora caninum Liverpool]|uniref:Transmembrane protein n=1 Tax=Neospora caninum (strain Liverpool) TaxID=572307 RepID=F0VPX6_NEOCL|nr:conserved hypothetical protein [Neospora caninum Liverpool]CBZ55773.1 conserved hypothetical protein [Neospora caninum Liverpool]CEL70517.1 TPA: hypothetical protein BN1204_061990 [Neospora caninum Liverpool]|eukprot:XP_003885799.1 conserved hypothetical protein [Neospora caninum Liverpool]
MLRASGSEGSRVRAQLCRSRPRPSRTRRALSAASLLVLLGSGGVSLAAPALKPVETELPAPSPLAFLSATSPATLLASLAAPSPWGPDAPGLDGLETQSAQAAAVSPSEESNGWREGEVSSRPAAERRREVDQRTVEATEESANSVSTLSVPSPVGAANVGDAQASLLSFWRRRKAEETPLPSTASPITEAPAALQSALPFATWFGLGGKEGVHAERVDIQARLLFNEGTEAPRSEQALSSSTGESEAAPVRPDPHASSWFPSLFSGKTQTFAAMNALDGLTAFWFPSLRRGLGLDVQDADGVKDRSTDSSQETKEGETAADGTRVADNHWSHITGTANDPLPAARAAAWWFAQREEEVRGLAKAAAHQGSENLQHAADSATATAQAFWHQSGGAQASQEALAALEASAQWFRQQKNKLEELDAAGAAAWWEAVKKSQSDRLAAEETTGRAQAGAAAFLAHANASWMHPRQGEKLTAVGVDVPQAAGLAPAFLVPEGLAFWGTQTEENAAGALPSRGTKVGASQAAGPVTAQVPPAAAVAAAAAAAGWLNWSRTADAQKAAPPQEALSWFWSKQLKDVEDAVEMSSTWLGHSALGNMSRGVALSAAVGNGLLNVPLWGEGRKEVAETKEPETVASTSGVASVLSWWRGGEANDGENTPSLVQDEAPRAASRSDEPAQKSVEKSLMSWVRSWFSGGKEDPEAVSAAGLGEEDVKGGRSATSFARWFGQKQFPSPDTTAEGKKEASSASVPASRWFESSGAAGEKGEAKGHGAKAASAEKLSSSPPSSADGDVAFEQPVGLDKPSEPAGTAFGWPFQSSSAEPNYPSRGGQSQHIEDGVSRSAGSSWVPDTGFLRRAIEGASRPEGAQASLAARASQFLAQNADQASGWIFGGASESESHAEKPAAPVPGLKQGSSWWEWESSETVTTTKPPKYTRDVRLDCNPVPPFRACVQKCQSDSRRHTKDNADRSEPQALGSYEYGSLRSCYLTCKQKWIDTDLPGCLRADGVKVEGVPPIEAFRSTTTSTTTTPSTTTTTPHPKTSTQKREQPKPTEEAAKSFWDGLTGKTEGVADKAQQEEQKGLFSLFQRATPTSTTTTPAPPAQGFSLTKLLGFHPTASAPASAETPSSDSFPFSLRGPSSLWSAKNDAAAGLEPALGNGLFGSLFSRSDAALPSKAPLAAQTSMTDAGLQEADLSNASVSEKRKNESAGWWTWPASSAETGKEGAKASAVAAGVRGPDRAAEGAAYEAPESTNRLVEEADDAIENVLSSWWPVFLLVVGVGLLVLCFLGRRLGQWEGMAGSGDIERGEYAAAPVFRESATEQHDGRRSVNGPSTDENRQPLIDRSG